MDKSNWHRPNEEMHGWQTSCPKCEMTHETETDDAQKPQPKPTCNSLETWAYVEHLRLWRQSLDQAAEQLARTRSHFRFVSVLVWVQTLLLLAWIVAWCVRT